MKFCVYEHWRADKGRCFYVGKASGADGRFRRAYEFRHSRSRPYRNVVSALRRLGLLPEVRVVFATEEEAAAYADEIRRIAHWRSAGIRLANVASGGGLNSGWKLSDERRREIGDSKRGNAYRLGAQLTEETKRKISESQRGKVLTAAHKSTLSKALSGSKNPFFNKTHGIAARRAVAKANHRRIWSTESRKKLSSTLTGRPGHKKRGWKHGPAARERYRAAALLRWKQLRALSAA